jgi:protoheme IX farnesyltransferase
LAIALMYREDYSQAGYHMLPSFDLDSRFTTAEIIFFTVALIVTTMLPLRGSVTAAYLIGMALAGVFLLYHAAKLTQSGSKTPASRLLHASVIYLPVVLVIMMIGKAPN